MFAILAVIAMLAMIAMLARIAMIAMLAMIAMIAMRAMIAMLGKQKSWRSPKLRNRLHQEGHEPNRTGTVEPNQIEPFWH